jgi:hypothetical protein
MSQEIDLNDVYRGMVGFAGYETTSDGFVRMAIGVNEKTGEKEYLQVTARDGNPVALPIKERLRDPDADKIEIFHILRENVGIKDTDLMQRYRHWVIARFNWVIGELGSHLLGIAASKSRTKNLNPAQARAVELINAHDKVDEDTLKFFTQIAARAADPKQAMEKFVTGYISSAHPIDGKTYKRACIVNFPFAKALKELSDKNADHKVQSKKKNQVNKPDSSIFDVTIRSTIDLPAYRGLIDYLIPGVGQVEYSVGSNSRIAPSTDALMQAFLPLAVHLNTIVDLFKGESEMYDALLDMLHIDVSWSEALADLEALWPQIRRVPGENQSADEVDDVQPKAKAGGRQPPPWEDLPDRVSNKDRDDSRSSRDRDSRPDDRREREDRDDRERERTRGRDREERDTRRDSRDDSRGRDETPRKTLNVAEAFGHRGGGVRRRDPRDDYDDDRGRSRGGRRDSRDDRDYDRGRDRDRGGRSRGSSYGRR